MSPTARTLKMLRDDGWTAATVEFWNAHTCRRQDLFGFADVLAFRGSELILVQATSGANTSARKKKILANSTARAWISTGRPIWVVGWRQLVARRKDGSKAKRRRWQPKIEILAVGSCEPV